MTFLLSTISLPILNPMMTCYFSLNSFPASMLSFSLESLFGQTKLHTEVFINFHCEHLYIQLRHDTYSFILPTSKTDHIFEGNCILIKDDTSPGPLAPFHSYLNSHDSLFPHCTELWLHKNSSVLTWAWFLNKLLSYFPRNTAGQSIHVGDLMPYWTLAVK
jgi:hypothetical protein